jgi:hypothetical protein
VTGSALKKLLEMLELQKINNGEMWIIFNKKKSELNHPISYSFHANECVAQIAYSTIVETVWRVRLWAQNSMGVCLICYTSKQKQLLSA